MTDEMNRIKGEQGTLGGPKKIEQTDEEELLMRKKYGFLPTSVWWFDKSEAWQRFIDDDLAKGSYGQEEKIRLSQFNPRVAEKIVKLWSREDDHILDPFSGRARSLVAMRLNRRYTGYEVSPVAHKQIVERLARPTLFEFKYKAKVICDDSNNISAVEEFDLVFSCPPYWNVEDYNKAYKEDIAGQLSEYKDYQEFLVRYQGIIAKCFTALKKGKFAVFVVNDIRRNKTLIPFGFNTITAFQNVGFTLHDIIINKLNSLSVLGVGMAVSLGYTPKVHEYILVFKKPEAEADEE